MSYLQSMIKEMDPEVALRIIQGYEDELAPAAKAQDAFYRQFACPRCKCGLNKEFSAGHSFNSEGLLPRALLRCPECRYLVEPHSGVILERGEVSVPLTPEETEILSKL